MVEMTKFFSSIFECLRELGRKTMKYHSTPLAKALTRPSNPQGKFRMASTYSTNCLRL
jgi:hypothetical protein